MAVIATLDDLKTWLAIASSEVSIDENLQTLLDGVDQAFRDFMGRELLISRRIETVSRTRRFQRRLTLRNAPITSVVSVNADLARTFGASTVIASSTYVVFGDQGVIVFDDDLPEGAGVVRVTYDAGLASDATDFQSKYPRLHQLALQQAQYEYQRRNSAGASSDVAQGASKVWTGQVQLLNVVKDALSPYRRVRLGG